MRIQLFLTILLSVSLFCCQKEEHLFEKINAAKSGLDFSNSLKPNEVLNAFTFTNYYNGGGVGVGDFNQDGLPDLFFAGNQVSSALYLNQGDFTFKDISQTAGISTERWCSGISVVDLNQDGWDDIYVSVAQGPGLKNSRNLLFINQKTKNPSFVESAQAYGLDYEGFTTQSAFFDYDLDGDLDAFLLNTNPDLQNPSTLRRTMNNGNYPSSDKLLRNEGPGPKGHPVFSDVSVAAGIRYEGLGLGVVISDLNQDGWPDIYCSNDFMSSDILYLNQGDGTFENTIQSAMPHTSLFGMGVDAADLNNDGKTDLFQLDMLPEDNTRQKEMLGKHDFDKKELSISPEFGYELQYMRNMLQVNSGNGPDGPMFSDLGLLAGVAKTDWSWAVLLNDLNLDGHKDIFITTGYRKNITDLDFIHYFQGATFFGSDAAKAEVREKLLEKVPEVKLRNYAYQNKGGLKFENVSKAWGLDELSYSNGAAWADLDRDGDLDLVVNNVDGPATLFKNHSKEKLAGNHLMLNFEGPAGNLHGIGAQVRVWNKGKMQFFEHFPVRGYLSSVEKGINVGLGKNEKIDSIQVRWPQGLQETRYQLNANQRLTFSYAKAKDRPQSRAKANPIFANLDQVLSYQHQESDFIDFNQTFALHKMLSRNGPVAAVADLNGDQLNDVVIGGALRGSPSQLFLQQKNGSFQAVGGLEAIQHEIGALSLFDADTDGDRDLLVLSGNNESDANGLISPQLWLNDGKAHFSLAAFPKLGICGQSICPFDYDGDGDMDLFLGGRQVPNAYPMPASSYLLRNDRGVFTDISPQNAPFLKNFGLVCDAISLDVDQDQDPDLVLVGEWMPLGVLINDRGQFKLQVQTNSEGWWNSIAAGDFDGDGDADLLLGNEGRNSFYHASPQEPIEMLAKDFNQDGKVDPLMGHYFQGQCFPALPRDALNQQMVQYRKKYPSYADFAKLRFANLVPAADQKGALHLQAKELRSCYAENLGNGKFKLRALPLEAQVAPIFGFLLADFDGDKKLDALASGNFHPNEGHLGRQDASRGVLLKGDGRGGFSAIPNEASGLSLPGDTRKSYWLDQKRFFTAVNRGGVLVRELSARSMAN
jgi:enediyne biosynthesis protein E4